jgi:hypothetical protein
LPFFRRRRILSEMKTMAPLLAALLSLVSCANTNARYDEAQRAFSAGAWQRAIEGLESFLKEADCAATTNDARCEEANVAIAECQLRLGDPTKAFFALESSRQREQGGGPRLARIERLQKEAQDTLAARLSRSPGEGSLSVRLRSQTRDHLRFHQARIFLDLHPLPTDRTPYVGGTTALIVPPTPVSQGSHELEVLVAFRGNGSGNLEYLNGYKFWTRSAQALVVGPTAPVEVEVLAHDVPGAPIVDSLRLDFVVR